MLIQEQELERLTLCPLLIPTSPSKMETCAKALVAWALRQSLEGSLKGHPTDILRLIRGKVLDLYEGGDAGIVARKTAFNLFNLLLDYEVLHLEQPYFLILAGYTIKGQYALLRQRKGLCLPRILILHAEEPKLRHDSALPPTVSVMARYVHLVTTTKYTNGQVLNYSVLKGKSWVNRDLDLALAKKYLESMLRVADIRPEFPRMGDHCSECSTKPCLGVFDGQDDDPEPGRSA